MKFLTGFHKLMVYQTDLGGRILKIEPNSLASQASGSALVSFGNTMVLATATLSPHDSEADFLPLTVDYQERYYAAGKISGSRYMRREGKPSDEAILVSRLIDRAIRPYFPQNLRREVQVIVTTLSYDGQNDPDFPGLIGASIALLVSSIPWKGPVGGIRIGSLDGKTFLLNPTFQERERARLDCFVSGVEDDDGKVLFNMLDGGGKETPEDLFFEGLAQAKEEIKKLIIFQKEIQKKEGKEKILEELFSLPEPALLKKLFKKYYKKVKENLLLMREEDGKERSSQSQAELKEKLDLDSFTFEKLVEKTLHQLILKEDTRPDGRRLNEIRKIAAKVGILPTTHGSGLFCRGLTHVLSILTLGAPGDELLLEGMKIVGKKRFLCHYNFPPYSAGEVGVLRAPNRREIGHGALVEKALRPLVPETSEFPYAIRIVSEILSSNGSTSMASVCAGSLALFDGGVLLKRAVAGISCGLMSEGEESYKILTDIQGPEDELGEMDLKIAGTREGITALQMDTKIRGLTEEILKKGFMAAKQAREFILSKMEETLLAPRENLSPFAPKIVTLQIKPEKIREVIGPEGKVINQIIDKTNTSIDIEEDGLIFITGETLENAKKAVAWIKDIVREVKEGEIFQGRIKRIMNFGVIVEIFPGQDALLHVSEVFPLRKVSIWELQKRFKAGELIKVRAKRVDLNGRIDLALLETK